MQDQIGMHKTILMVFRWIKSCLGLFTSMSFLMGSLFLMRNKLCGFLCTVLDPRDVFSPSLSLMLSESHPFAVSRAVLTSRWILSRIL